MSRICAIGGPPTAHALDGPSAWQAAVIETVRIDQWLWSVRMTRTRADAAALCRSGHVTVNDRTAKPSTPVKVGDRVVARVHQRERILDVVGVISKRVGAGLAADHYVDHSPPPPEREAVVFARDRGTGRPTKRDRRQLDKLRGRPRR